MTGMTLGPGKQASGMTLGPGKQASVIGVLGPTTLAGPDGAVRLGSSRQRRLLAALALHAGSSVSAGLLTELVWDPSDAPADPSGALQTNVARLRRALPAAVRIVTTAQGYQLTVEPDADCPYPVDVMAFDALLARAAGGGDRLALLAAALRLWRGEPYQELDHPVVAPEVARLTELHAGAVEQHAEALLVAGRLPEAIAALEALTVSEPLREGAVALLMRALVAAGRQSDALAAYRRLRARLGDELGLDPSTELRSLEQQVLRQELVPPPSRLRAGLPRAPLSSFVGRRSDLDLVSHLLDECRVVTLCGPGGVGKSRLATHAALAVADRYEDGVLTVELADGGPSDVEPALAAALRLADSAESTLATRIVEVLAVRRQLLLLDNCEHVADQVAALVESITAGAAGVDLLLTSREPLRVDGEHVLPVAPLPADVAAALLADRIRAVDPSAPPPDGELLDEVCRRLDGLPLALELAAPRVPALGLRGLLDALGEPFDVLRRGRRTAAPRHRSLREVVEWSYGLLDEEQRALFVRLATFAGSVEPAAVAAVCGSARALPDLVERSLVVRNPGEPDTFGMLETLRAFGRSHLATDPATPALRARHARWAVQLATEVQAAHEQPDEATAIRRFDTHLADLRQAHGWLCANGPLEDLLTLTLTFADQAYLRARIDLVLLVEQALAVAGVPRQDTAPEAGVAHPLLARLLGLAAMSSWQRGDLTAAEARCTQAFAVAEAIGEPAAARDAYEALANVRSFSGDLHAASQLCHRSRELSVQAGDRWSELMALVDLAIVNAYAGDHAGSEEYDSLGTALAERMGAPSALAWAAYVAGERRAEAGSPDAATYLERAIALATEVDAGFVVGIARHTLLTTAARSGDPAVMLPRFSALIDHWHGVGAWTQLWIAVRALIETLARDGRHREVAVLLGALRASALATPEFGTDSVRTRAAEDASRAALGPLFDDLLVEGAALGDSAAVAFARRVAAAGSVRFAGAG